MNITVGYTKTDRAHDYIPCMDGFRAGADQELVKLDVMLVGVAEPLAVAEDVFIATNAPDEVTFTWNQGEIRRALAGRRSVSVGDTVDVNGHTFACARLGWEPLHAGDLTTREVVVQSALIHPDWTAAEHIAFLESEHDVDVTPYTVERLRADVIRWMAEAMAHRPLAL
jgi:hypothetical protein